MRADQCHGAYSAAGREAEIAGSPEAYGAIATESHLEVALKRASEISARISQARSRIAVQCDQLAGCAPPLEEVSPDAPEQPGLLGALGGLLSQVETECYKLESEVSRLENIL